MRFQLPTVAAFLSLALLTFTLAHDAGVSSIVSEIDSIKSELYALSTQTNNAVAASSLGSVLASYIVSVSTNSDWPAASSVLSSQAAIYSAKLSSIHGSRTATETKTTASSLLGALSTQASSATSSATSAGLAPMVTAGISGMMAMGVLGAAVLL